MTELKLEKKKPLGFISSFMIHVSFHRQALCPSTSPNIILAPS